MGPSRLVSRIAGLAFLGLTLSACSEVAFEPSPVDTSLEAPLDDGYKLDTYFFNGEKPLTKVDVLFVIDNSTSMAEEQQKLAQRLSSFVDTLADVDWQVGITTTDISGGAHSTNGDLVNMEGTTSHVLTKKVPNYEQVFLNTVTAHGTPAECVATRTNCADGNERPLQAVQMAVDKRNSENLGFFRGGADFVMIVLSDENESSNGPVGAVTGEQLVGSVVSAWGGTKFFTGYGLIIQPTDKACMDEQKINGGQVGTFVQHLADITNGETGSICANDYGPALDSIGQRVKRFATTIALSALPVAGSVEVKLTPANPLVTWQVVGQTIRLSDLPAKGTRVDIVYKVQ